MRKSRLVAVVVCLTAGALLSAGPRASQHLSSSSQFSGTLTRAPGDRHVLVALPYSAGTRVGDPPAMSARLVPQNAATVNVTYIGFGAFPAAQAAFQHAVNIWQTQITSSVPITVRAEFLALPPGVLGSAGPTDIARNFSGAPQANVWYPVAIANKLSGVDGNPADVDIEANFNSTFSNWYFGTDGNPGTSEYDFVSVVLHELGHGLGFLGSMSVTSGSGGWGFGTGFPMVYDTLAVNGSVQSLINLSLFPNPSASLASQLQSNNIFWNGAAGGSANSGARPKLYAPASWVQGSSYAHLDEVTYPEGNPNSLMTYALAQDEVIHSPGPIVLGMFQDMGWTATNCIYSITPTSTSFGASGGTGSVSVTTQTGCGWSAISNSSFVTITSPNSGSGNGTVTYFVAQNTGTARSATLTIAGQVFTINQAAACTYTLNPTSASYTAAGGSASVIVTTQAGCSWTATSNNPSFVTISAPAGSVTGSGVVNYTVAPNGVSFRSGAMTIAGRTFAISQFGTGPSMSLNRQSLVFGATTSGGTFVAQTQPQTVRLLQIGGTGTVTWTVSSNQPWLTVSPTSGSGPATLTISVNPTLTVPPAGVVSGSIAFNLVGAGNTAGPLPVSLKTYVNGTSSSPFGSFDSPASNATGVTGSLPVTGWALDDVQVATVSIYRDAVSPEAPGLRFIGHAHLVDGARPDLIAPYAGVPLNTRGGWGYMMLTNMLPNRGNGTFVLHAYAVDREGRQTLLGSKTITCANSGAVKPFGAIDTPSQGETITGTLYNNFGWVLAPGDARADVPGGGSVTVFIDGAPVGSPGAWGPRPDISALFPEADYSGVNFAQAVFTFNPSTYADGVHTISWTVFDNLGHGAGIGSRYFTVVGGTGLTAASSALLTRSLADEVLAAPRDRSGIAGRRGYDLATPYRAYAPDASGTNVVHGEEVDRFELQLAAPPQGTEITGHLRVGGDLRPLPIGSNLDAGTGAFTWQPGAGFIGAYDLTFVRWANGRALSRQDVRIVLNPKGSGRVGPQVVIDLPALVGRNFSSASVAQPFVVAGWAADLDAWSGTGIGTLHVWAYPAHGGPPIFLGATAYGGMRPDVAAVYGDQFTNSGYGLIVRSLPPGPYMLAVFGYSEVQNGFVPAKTVWVTVQ